MDLGAMPLAETGGGKGVQAWGRPGNHNGWSREWLEDDTCSLNGKCSLKVKVHSGLGTPANLGCVAM